MAALVVVWAAWSAGLHVVASAGAAPAPGLSFAVKQAGGAPATLQEPLVRPGERFNFLMGYMGVMGARATVSVDQEGELVTITGDVENTWLLRFVFRVRDRFQSVVDQAVGSTVRTRLWQDEPGTKRYREEVFYTDQVVVLERAASGERKRQVPVSGPILDPLAALFLIRGQRLAPGDVVEGPIFANNRVFHAHVHVAGRDKVNALGRAWPAIKLAVSFSRDGKHLEDANATFWISDDEDRVPLRGTAATGYGPVSATLTGRK
jgi:hypothetical protein